MRPEAARWMALGAVMLVLTASTADADDPPGSRAAGRVVEVLEGIRQGMRETRYQHHRTVRVRRGQYFFDCSGMVQWVLSRSSRRSMVPLEPRERPLAIDFVRRIERAPVDRYRGGWRRIARMVDVRPGDVFAWRRPPDFQSANTGHVGFVVETPQPVTGHAGYFTVRIADASRYTHQNDTRPWPGPGGFGHGTILFSVNEQGEPTGYGWSGLLSRGTWQTDVVFGRVGP